MSPPRDDWLSRLPDDDGIRFGKLLFGETLSDYAGWSDAAGGSEAATKDRLLGR